MLWFEHDLFDQLNLIQLLDRLAQAPRRARLTLVSIDSYPGYPNFHGMGELKPAEIASLFTTRQEVSEAQFTLASRAYAAFRASTPAELEALLQTDTSALPFLAPALARHLEEFPAGTTGLSRTEALIIAAVEHAPVGIVDVFRQVHAGERYFFIGDSSFWTIVVRLATATPALIDVEIASASSQALPNGTIRITDSGAEVLKGRADRIALCGIDRWLGGVHLTDEQPWRRQTAPAL